MGDFPFFSYRSSYAITPDLGRKRNSTRSETDTAATDYDPVKTNTGVNGSPPKCYLKAIENELW